MTLPSVRSERHGRSCRQSAPAWPFRRSASAGSITSASTIAMSSTISQPTAIRPRSVSTRRRSCNARSSTTVRGDRQAPDRRPARRRGTSRERCASAMPSKVATAIWPIAPGIASALDRQQIVKREMQPDAEHQQNDADLGELIGDILVGDIARRERAHQDAGEQIPDQRRDAQALRERAENEGKYEADRRWWKSAAYDEPWKIAPANFLYGTEQENERIRCHDIPHSGARP